MSKAALLNATTTPMIPVIRTDALPRSDRSALLEVTASPGRRLRDNMRTSLEWDRDEPSTQRPSLHPHRHRNQTWPLVDRDRGARRSSGPGLADGSTVSTPH